MSRCVGETTKDTVQDRGGPDGGGWGKVEGGDWGTWV